MAFLSEADANALRERFERDLRDDVRVRLFVQPPTGLYLPGREEPQFTRETQQLMEELVDLSPRLHLDIHNPRAEPEVAARYGIERTPAIVLEPEPALPAGERGAVRFFGLPAGYEFGTLVEDLVDLSAGQTRLSPTTRDALAALPGDVHLQVFVTPT